MLTLYMSRRAAKAVLGHRIPAPRVTVWVPFLIATALSLPVVVITLLSLL